MEYSVYSGRNISSLASFIWIFITPNHGGIRNALMFWALKGLCSYQCCLIFKNCCHWKHLEIHHNYTMHEYTWLSKPLLPSPRDSNAWNCIIAMLGGQQCTWHHWILYITVTNLKKYCKKYMFPPFTYLWCAKILFQKMLIEWRFRYQFFRYHRKKISSKLILQSLLLTIDLFFCR